jgi:hypothetical protein
MTTPLQPPSIARPPVSGFASPCKPFCKAPGIRVALVGLAMAGFLAPLLRLKRSEFALANSPGAASEHYLGLANDVTIGADGWVVIPYGDSRHSGKEGRIGGEAERTPEQIEAEQSGVVQRFSREDAVALVNDFKSTWGRLKRAVVGLPVFKGHPDAPRFAARFPDKVPRGTIADMEARADGLALRPVLTEQGAADVEAGHKFVSPYWLGRHVGDEAGRKIIAPFKLFSLGLVPRGNIPDLSLVNAADAPCDSVTMKETLRKFLASIGLSGVTTPPENADETALANSLDTAATAINTLKTEKQKAGEDLAAAQARVTALEGEKLALANSVETEKTRATAAETSLKVVRTTAAKRVVGAAVKAGKISAADSTAQETALTNAADFEAEAARIDALKPALRTATQLGDLGRQGKEQQGRSQQALALVNSYMEGNGCDYDTAFNAVQADPKHAALFSGMKRAGAVT